MPSDTPKHYEEQGRFEYEGSSIGYHIAEVYWEPDVTDEGTMTGSYSADVIINTDAQRPFTQDELDDWCDHLADAIREIGRNVD